MTRRSSILAALLAPALCLPASAPAQIRASELATVSQTIDGTKIAMTYSRPRVRGRQPLWGTKIVHWGEVWTPGANWATTFEASKDVKLNGLVLPKGKYSMWLIVREKGDWTAVFDTTARRFHMDRPDTMKAALRVPIKVGEGPFIETLTWTFADLRNDGATLTMSWERRQATMDVKVEPSLRYDIAAEDAKPYLGRWETVEYMPGDTTKSRKKDFIITHRNGRMEARFEPEDPYMKTFALIRLAPDMFTGGVYDEKGEIYEVLRPDMMLTFKREGGTPTSFEVRGEQDDLWARGKRKN